MRPESLKTINSLDISKIIQLNTGYDKDITHGHKIANLFRSKRES